MMRCEGWTRKGGAFTLGAPEWKQCENEAVVNLTFEQDGEIQTMPACLDCWKTAKTADYSQAKVVAAEPIIESEDE